MNLLAIKGIVSSNNTNFPFNLPLIQNFKRMEFKTPVTFFVGENGSGKSTILEALAHACDLPVIGSENINLDKTLNTAKDLGRSLKLEWSLKTKKGFFLRAEDFFGYTKALIQNQALLKSQLETFENELPEGYGKILATGSIKGQLKQLKNRYGEDLNANSHGESFLKLFNSRIQPDGLYLLDEPETPLSPTRQLSLLSIIKQMIKKNCQFIIVTHSPILMAFPKASIYNFDSATPELTKYENLEHVNLTRDFLTNPQVFIDRL